MNPEDAIKSTNSGNQDQLLAATTLDQSKILSPIVNERKELINNLGVAERNSLTCKLEMAGEIDNKQVRILLVRKRGMETGTVTYVDIGGAGMFRNLQAAENLLTSLEPGDVSPQDYESSHKKTGKERTAWVNGYVIQKIVQTEEGEEIDARVLGFNSAWSQAEYEIGVAEAVDFSATMSTETAQELSGGQTGEWPGIAKKASAYFAEGQTSKGWQTAPEVLSAELSQVDYSDPDRILPTAQNRESHKGGTTTKTHGIIMTKEVRLNEGTIRSLVDSGHCQLVDGETTLITSPLIAVDQTFLEKEVQPLMKLTADESLPTKFEFGNADNKAKVRISNGIFD